VFSVTITNKEFGDPWIHKKLYWKILLRKMQSLESLFSVQLIHQSILSMVLWLLEKLNTLSKYPNKCLVNKKYLYCQLLPLINWSQQQLSFHRKYNKTRSSSLYFVSLSALSRLANPNYDNIVPEMPSSTPDTDEHMYATIDASDALFLHDEAL
jgi:hypothetical protein